MSTMLDDLNSEVEKSIAAMKEPAEKVLEKVEAAIAEHKNDLRVLEAHRERLVETLSASRLRKRAGRPAGSGAGRGRGKSREPAPVA